MSFRPSSDSCFISSRVSKRLPFMFSVQYLQGRNTWDAQLLFKPFLVKDVSQADALLWWKSQFRMPQRSALFFWWFSLNLFKLQSGNVIDSLTMRRKGCVHNTSATKREMGFVLMFDLMLCFRVVPLALRFFFFFELFLQLMRERPEIKVCLSVVRRYWASSVAKLF